MIAMSDRDRFIELLDDLGVIVNVPDNVDDDGCGTYTVEGGEYVADYLLANGVIVPPCKVGDTVYTIFEGKIEALKIIHTYIEENTKCIQIHYDAENKFLKMPFAYCHIGKSIFLTKEEAEQALVTDTNVGSKKECEG